MAQADDAAGHYNLAVQYKREGKITEAVAECQKALKLRPELRRGAHDAGQPVPRPEELPDGGGRIRDRW